MGYTRKTAIIATGGLARAVINPNSKKERTANTLEKQYKLQKQQARASAQSTLSPRGVLSLILLGMVLAIIFF